MADKGFMSNAYEAQLWEDLAFNATLALIKQDAPPETPHPYLEMTIGEVIKGAGLTAKKIKAIKSGAWDGC